MFENVWSVRGLPNMNWNIVNLYVLKLLSLKKVVHFQYLQTLKYRKFNRFFRRNDCKANKSDNKLWKRPCYGRVNKDIKRTGVGSNHLSDFRDLFHLTDIVKFTTCFTKTHISLIEYILTNKPLSFNKTLTC